MVLILLCSICLYYLLLGRLVVSLSIPFFPEAVIWILSTMCLFSRTFWLLRVELCRSNFNWTSYGLFCFKLMKNICSSSSNKKVKEKACGFSEFERKAALFWSRVTRCWNKSTPNFSTQCPKTSQSCLNLEGDTFKTAKIVFIHLGYFCGIICHQGTFKYFPFWSHWLEGTGKSKGSALATW